MDSLELVATVAEGCECGIRETWTVGYTQKQETVALLTDDVNCIVGYQLKLKL